MIRYQLNCDRGHNFDGWFRTSDDFDRQKKRGLVDCPECGSRKVSKALMAPSVATSRKRQSTEARHMPVASHASEPPEIAARRKEVMAMMRKMRSDMLSSSEDVGKRFAEEARKIHHQETEARGIHGEASPNQVRDLIDEGIEVYPIPSVPDEHN